MGGLSCQSYQGNFNTSGMHPIPHPGSGTGISGIGFIFGMSNLWSVITLRSGSLNWYLGSGIWIGLKSNFGGTYGSADP